MPILSSAGGGKRGIGGDPWENPEGQQKILGQGKKPHGRIAIVSVALVAILAVVALAVVAVPNIIRVANPKAYLAGCMEKTVSTLKNESKKASDSLGIWDIMDSIEDSRMEQNISLTLKEVPESIGSEASILLGSNLSAMFQSDLKNRKMAGEYRIGFSTLDLVSIRFFADDSKLSTNCPELLHDAFYGIDTETIGADFNRNEIFRDSVDPDLSFNLFDVIESMQKEEPLFTDETLAELARLAKELTKEMDVKKDGNVNVEINDATEKLPQYTVTMPAAAVRDWLRGSIKAELRDANINESLELLLIDYPGGKDAYLDDLEEGMLYALDMLKGDVTMTLSIRNGYIAKAVILCNINDVDTTLDIQIGTAKSAIDAFTMNLEMENAPYTVRVTLISDSEHGKDGMYSNSGKLMIYENGTSYGGVEWSGELNTKRKDDNFSFHLDFVPYNDYSDAVSFQMEGTVEVDKRAKSLTADFDRIALIAEGESLAVSCSYTVAPFKEFAFEPKEVQMLVDMNEAQLEALEDEIERNAQELYYNIARAFY